MLCDTVPMINIVTDITENSRTEIISAFRHFNISVSFISANLNIIIAKTTMQAKHDFDWDTYNWDIKGNNCYDSWIQEFRKGSHDGVVKNITVSALGDLTIETDSGMVIEVFVNTAVNECWRFFERNSDEHFIMNGNGIEKRQPFIRLPFSISSSYYLPSAIFPIASACMIAS